MTDAFDIERYLYSVGRCIRSAVAASDGVLQPNDFGHIGGTHEFEGRWSAGVLIASRGLPGQHPTFTGYGATEDEAVADMARQVAEAFAPTQEIDQQ